MLKSKVSAILGKRIGKGRFLMPVWALGLAVAIVGAAAGQAVGPILAGSTTGTVNLTVEQSITLDTDYDLGDNLVINGDGDAVATRNDGARTSPWPPSCIRVRKSKYPSTSRTIAAPMPPPSWS